MDFDFGTNRQENKTTNKKIDDTYESINKYNKYAEKEAKERIYEEKVKLQNQFNTYFVIYFDSDDEKIEFCRKNKIDQDFVYGKDISRIIKN